MLLQIKNLTNRPVLIRLNSGQTIRIEPNAIARDIKDFEIKDNAQIKKLFERSIISQPNIEKSAAVLTDSKKKLSRVKK